MSKHGPETRDARRPVAGIDSTVAHPARVYDYLLGGKDNWAADREVGDAMMGVVPYMHEEMRANRAFLQRTVRYAAQQGINQFLDIGTGLPTVGPTHEAARTVRPDAQVTYVDNDPVVLAHARALLVNDDRTHALLADARDPESIMEHPQVQTRIDFDRPVALMFVFVLHFLDDEEIAGLLARYTRYVAPGSMLIISHGLDSPACRAGAELYKATTPMTLRSTEEIAGLFTGWDLVDPGLVPIREWRPDPGDEATLTYHGIGGVGVRP